MFTENSRYYSTSTVATTDSAGREVTALKRRVIPGPVSGFYTVKNYDRLDIMAHEAYGDATKFWHIADANTELEASRLTEEPGSIIQIPQA